jgi:hypothetical protein
MTHLNNARRLRPIVERAMQSVEGNDALTAKSLYPAFASLAGQTVQQGFKFTYGDRLWRVIQPELILREQFVPGVGTESLYEEVCEIHLGTREDPIPYDGNMVLASGLYYMQEGAVYLCTRDTGNPVYHALADLVGQYVEVVQA